MYGLERKMQTLVDYWFILEQIKTQHIMQEQSKALKVADLPILKKRFKESQDFPEHRM